MKFISNLDFGRQIGPSCEMIASLSVGRVAYMLTLVLWSCCSVCFAQNLIRSSSSGSSGTGNEKDESLQVYQPAIAGYETFYPQNEQLQFAANRHIGSNQIGSREKPCWQMLAECKEAMQSSPQTAWSNCIGLSQLPVIYLNRIICVPFPASSPHLQSPQVLPRADGALDDTSTQRKYHDRLSYRQGSRQGGEQVPDEMEPKKESQTWRLKLSQEDQDGLTITENKQKAQQPCNESSDQKGKSCLGNKKLEFQTMPETMESRPRDSSWFRERFNRLRLSSEEARRFLEQGPTNALFKIEDGPENGHRQDIALIDTDQHRLRSHRSDQEVASPARSAGEQVSIGSDQQSTIECSLRLFTFRAQRTDANGLKCWAQVVSSICYGGCDTGEISDWLFPHKKSIHRVCGHGQRQRRTIYLTDCEEGFDERLREYHYVDAKSCVCQRCNSADSTCLGSLTQPYLEAADDTTLGDD